MDDTVTHKNRDWLADRFEDNRAHLRAVAFRMLGSLSEAEDAVQEAWLRLSRSDTAKVDNLGGWLTTVVSRVCLDMLRSRESRREQSLDDAATGPIVSRGPGSNPEQEAQLADSVGAALLVVLCRMAKPSVKDWALSKITVENGKFVHESVRTYFTPEGAQNAYSKLLGIAGPYEDTFDDHC